MLIYVVDDDFEQRDYFTKILQVSHHEVIAFKDTYAAHNYLMAHNAPDAALIDFRLENGPNGLSLARKMHALHPSAAILMMSCYAEKEDIIEIFRNGVDDFLLKPVEIRELNQRLGDAVIERRSKYLLDSVERQLGALKLFPETRQAWWHGNPLALTKTQFTLLTRLTAQPGHIFNYADLYATCTGAHIDPAEAAKRLKTHLHNLKVQFKKVSPAPCPIVSRRGEGVLWQPESLPTK